MVSGCDRENEVVYVYDGSPVRARLVVPLVALCAALAAAPAALAAPHLNKVQSRTVSNIVERWVNDVVRGRDLADGWKIAGAAERGGITRKDWVSGRQLPVQSKPFMEVLNNPRTSWYATARQGNEIFLTVSLKTGHGKNAEMIENQTTLQKIHGRWLVYAFYTDGIFRLGKGHTGSCAQSNCRVTGINDYNAGGPVSGNGGASSARIGGAWGIFVVLGIPGLPFVALLVFGLVALRRNRQARRARIAYELSRTN